MDCEFPELTASFYSNPNDDIPSTCPFENSSINMCRNQYNNDIVQAPKPFNDDRVNFSSSIDMCRNNDNFPEPKPFKPKKRIKNETETKNSQVVKKQKVADALDCILQYMISQVIRKSLDLLLTKLLYIQLQISVIKHSIVKK